MIIIINTQCHNGVAKFLVVLLIFESGQKCQVCWLHPAWFSESCLGSPTVYSRMFIERQLRVCMCVEREERKRERVRGGCGGKERGGGGE